MLLTVPTVAQAVSTPLDLSAWCYFLCGYPDRDLVHFFSYKDGCGIHGCTCIKALKRRAVLGYRKIALDD